ncbi:MAG: hypothetical protein ACKOBV_09615 [Candidatus Kapaibacterium sp.]
MIRFVVVVTWFISVVIATGVPMRAQDMRNTTCGRINNAGTIRVRGSALSTPTASIDNKSGLFLFSGNTEIRQPEILGRVEYDRDASDAQTVPQIRHSVSVFTGKGPKVLDTTYNGARFISIDTLLTTANAKIIIDTKYPMMAQGRVTHDGEVNPSGGDGAVILSGTAAQNVDGQGVFRTLELDNTQDAFLINKAELTVRNNLYLHRGVLRSTADNNVRMADASRITRTFEGSTTERPLYDKRYSLHYIGAQAILTDKEVPVAPDVVQTLSVRNDGGVTMSENVTVNDSIEVGRPGVALSVRTEADTNKPNVLTFASKNNQPVYVDDRSEVVGTFRRSQLRTAGTVMTCNNRYTGIAFNSAAGLNGASTFDIESRPYTFPPVLNGTQKVRRSLVLTARDTSSGIIATGMQYRVDYAWINDSTNVAVNETNGLDAPNLILQYWNGARWLNNKSSRRPAQFTSSGWAYSVADTVRQSGRFAIGKQLPNAPKLVTKVFLEGAFRNCSMQPDLANEGLLPGTPPNVFPYSLDPYRATIALSPLPIDAIDWVVVELRRGVSTPPDIVKCGILYADGSIGNGDGKSRYMTFPDSLPLRDYHVIIRHRNHLAVMTAVPWTIKEEDVVGADVPLDIAAGFVTLGGSAAMKTVYRENSGAFSYAMIGGDVNGDDVVDDNGDRSDIDQLYTVRTRRGYLSEDADLNGIVTTRDFTLTWNNRTRKSLVPR